MPDTETTEITCSTIRDMLSLHASENGDATALHFYDEIVTYQQLDSRSSSFANYLRDRGVKKGDIVSFMLGNNPYFFYVLLGIQKIGAIAGPISCWWQAPEIEFLLNDSQSKILLLDTDYAKFAVELKGKINSVKEIIINSDKAGDKNRLADIFNDYPTSLDDTDNSIRPLSDDIASIMYTSGTTGKPKGVMLTHYGIIYGSKIKTEAIPMVNRVLCVLPLFHSGGLNDLAFPTLYKGSTIVLRRNFSASEFWGCVERYKIECFYIVPAMWNILLSVAESHTTDTSSLIFGVSGAASISPEQLQECEDRFNVPILEGYGLTESTGAVTLNRVNTRKVGSAGTVLSGLEMGVFEKEKLLSPGETGEVAIKGDIIMPGYHNRPEATSDTIRDGWLLTGDIGYIDEDGALFIVDRKKEMIIRGGVNIYPRELEHVISAHPKIDSIAIIPEAHEIYGEVAKACIVLKRGQKSSVDEILEFCKKNMAEYKVPETILFLEMLPTTPLGKVLKKELIRQLEEESTGEAVPVAHFFEGMSDRFLPDNAKDVQAVVCYQITGGGGGEWTAIINNGKFTLEKGIRDEYTAMVIARDRDYHDIATGTLDGLTALMTGKMKIKGDMSFMSKLRSYFRPIAGAKKNKTNILQLLKYLLLKVRGKA